VGTPLGQYPFEFRRVEWRGDGIAIVGIVAGLETSVTFGREDLAVVGKVAVASLGVAAVWRAVGRRRR
jgi:hypothetical protein